MKCPDCNSNLQEVATSGNYGEKIMLNQCSGCGGIWFDSLELYAVPGEEIGKIESVNLEKLGRRNIFQDKSGLCPACSAHLETFHDPNFPKGLEVEYCVKCGGLWVNRGEATSFKEWQDKKKEEAGLPKSPEDARFSENVRKLLDLDSRKNHSTLGELGKILTMKIDSRTYKPISSGSMGGDDLNSRRTVSAAVSVIRILLKLFVK